MSRLWASAAEHYVLTKLDVYDWGAFGGRHSAQINLAGTAIIGPTGSGKTTLVDALMTLLVANPRYNLASTGGHESDRDLVSYVRGVSGAGTEGGTEHIARSGSVVTAIAACFNDGDSVVRIGGIFWFEGTSSALADLKRRWLFSSAESPGLDDWLEAHRDGGARSLKELERHHAGLKIYEAKTAYLSRLRDHFGVGENAFALLNRAAGLKQLDSIDKVFRELVLDDHSQFSGARAVATEFETLAGIRQELETARVQRDSLLPLQAGWEDLSKNRQELEVQAHLKSLVPGWFARQAADRWRRRWAEFDGQMQVLEHKKGTAIGEVKQAERKEIDTHEAYLLAGGADIDRLREQIETQKSLVATRGRAAAAYQAKASALGMGTELSSASVNANLQAVADLRQSCGEDFRAAKASAFESGVARTKLEKEKAQFEQDLTQARARPGSNVPRRESDFRKALTDFLGLRESDVPFVAELIEVKAQERGWRGAIERAVGGERLRLLIEEQHAGAALDWINARDNRMHVRLHEVAKQQQSARFFDDGFTRKLNFKEHPLREALKVLLADIDRHCVADVVALRRTQHAMTAEGLMSGRARFFDKNDHVPLKDGWMTGFDNRDLIAELEAQLQRVGQDLGTAYDEERRELQELDALGKSLALLDSVEKTVFEDIDLPGAKAKLEALDVELTRRLSPASDAAQARASWQAAVDETSRQRQLLMDVEVELQVTKTSRDEADGRLQRLQVRMGPDPDGHALALADANFESVDAVAVEDLDEIERVRSRVLQAKIDAIQNRCGTMERKLISHMKDAKHLDTGALADVGTELQDVPGYLQRLQTLAEEGLPEKTGRFLGYLNQSSDQGVTQMLSEIENEVAVIEERIADLNATLKRVDFQPGRYLRLEPQRVEHESLRSLRQARAYLRSAQLKDDEGESHYRALSAVVALLRDAAERNKTLGALALLDPRYRLQFAVLVIERETGRLIEKRTSSQGGSGGEKEIIASYVLTASLSYALCPQGSERPMFGTIVLDEAFSKSSQAVAARIVRALAEFGLHPLFVTPNKELRLLREHTSSAIVVHRRGLQATMTSLSWESLDEHARRRTSRLGSDGEVS